MADSSAIIALSICDSLELLEALFDKVVVPELFTSKRLKRISGKLKDSSSICKEKSEKLICRIMFIWMFLQMPEKQRQWFCISSLLPTNY